MADPLVLGGIVFTNFSAPPRMPFGGQQAMVVHKLPGGSRPTDTLGPDEADIQWRGFFFGNDALGNCEALDAMRAAGAQVPLTFAGQYRTVLIKEFIPRIAREPVWVEYSITCTVIGNPQLGAIGTQISVVDDLIFADLGSLLALF